MLWSSSPVSEQPTCRLSQWAIIRRPDGAYVAAGHNLDQGWGRVSSRVVKVDRENMTLTTKSGRAYQLVGEPGWDGDGMYVYESMYGHDYTDATMDFLENPDFNPSTVKPLI